LVRLAARSLSQMFDPERQSHLPMTVQFKQVIKIISDIKEQPEDIEQFISDIKTQEIVFAAEMHLGYQVDVLNNALLELSNKFNVEFFAGSHNRLLPRLLELMGYPVGKYDFVKQMSFRLDHLCLENVALHIDFMDAKDCDQLVKNIGSKYKQQFGVLVYDINTYDDQEYLKRSAISLSIKSIVEDFLPKVTQADIDIMLANGFCNFKPKQSENKRNVRLSCLCS